MKLPFSLKRKIVRSKYYFVISELWLILKQKIFNFYFRKRFSDFESEKIKSESFGGLISKSLIVLVSSLLLCVFLYSIHYLLLAAPNFYQVIIIDEDNYLVLLSSITGVGGVFIGLYYTALSSVASSVYSKVPNNIKDLLSRERLGKTYMKFLAILTFSCLLLIGANLLGLPPVNIVVIVILIMSGLGVATFYNLGRRAFYLFDPTQLSKSLKDDLKICFRLVTPRKIYWNVDKAQSIAKSIARNSIETYETLAEYSRSEEHLSENSQFNLNRDLIELITTYIIFKNDIPTESEWFETRFEQKDWYKSSFTEYGTASSTGTQIDPQKVKDHWWFEDKVEDIIFSSFVFFIETNDLRKANRLIIDMSNYIEVLSLAGELERVFELWKRFTDYFIDYIINEKESLISDIEIISIAQLLFSIPNQAIVNFSRYCHNNDYDRYSTLTRKIQWIDKSSIYKNHFPFFLNERLEWLQKTLKFEVQNEGKRISPDWYIVELVGQELVGKITENTKLILNDFNSSYDDYFKKIFDGRYFFVAASIFSMKIEFMEKIDFHIPKISKLSNELTEKQFIENLPWNNISDEFYEEKISDIKNNISQDLVEITGHLSLYKLPEKFPDYLGQFLSRLTDKSVDLLFDNREKLFEDTFRALFASLFLKHEELRPSQDVREWEIESEIKKSAAPLLDLMDISGYAILFARFHDNDSLEQIVRNVWNIHFDENTEERLDYLLGMIFITHSYLEIAPSGIRLTQRRNRVSSFLGEVPRRLIERTDPGFRPNYTIADHESPLVRLCAPNDNFSGVSNYGGIDIFLGTYLVQEFDIEDEDLDLGTKNVERFLEAVQREIDNHQEHFEDEEDG